MIRMGVSGSVFLLVPAYPGYPGPKAVKRLCVRACVRACVFVCVCVSSPAVTWFLCDWFCFPQLLLVSFCLSKLNLWEL